MNKPKVTQISETLFTVLDHSVKIQTRKGRKILLCDCQNHTRFCIENPFCYHKELVIEFLSIKDIKEKLDKLIIQYEQWSTIKKEISTIIPLEDLKELRRLI